LQQVGSYSQEQKCLADLQSELKLDLENVRSSAIDYFIKGQYRECIRLLSLLSKIQPHDEELLRFLDLCCKLSELETARIDTLARNPVQVCKDLVDYSEDQPAFSGMGPVELLAQGICSPVDSAPISHQTPFSQPFDATESSSTNAQSLANEDHALRPTLNLRPLPDTGLTRSPSETVEAGTLWTALDPPNPSFSGNRSSRAWDGPR
jgi:hypothetical protein